MRTHLKAENSLSMMLAIALFAILCLSYMAWQSQQARQYAQIYQQQQALQIVENQIALKMVGKARDCESRVQQNGITFEITCSTNRIQVLFPTGEVTIERK